MTACCDGPMPTASGRRAPASPLPADAPRQVARALAPTARSAQRIRITPSARAAARWRAPSPRRSTGPRPLRRRGRHRRRQDLRVPGARSALRAREPCSAPPPRRCRTSCSCATCRACALPWHAGDGWRCSRAARATCALHRLGSRARMRSCPTASRCARCARVEAWAQTTVSGDLAELEGLDERSSVIPLVTSSRENCLGSECPQFRSATSCKARREAMAADLVVVNHHLFFADLALRDSGVAELPPSVEVAVFDEAHQLGEAGVQFLGTIARLVAADRLRARHAGRRACSSARGLCRGPSSASACDRSARDLRAGRRRPTRRGSRAARSCAGPSAATTQTSSPAWTQVRRSLRSGRAPRSRR